MAKPNTPHFHFIDDGQGSIRIWKSSNAGDQFDVVSQEELPLSVCEKLAQLRPEAFVMGFPESDDGETILCPICKAT
jgi:hypothetical protein